MLSNPQFVTFGLIICIVILVGWIVRIEIKQWKLLRGKNGQSLEDSIISAHENLEKLNEFQKESIKYLIDIERRLKRSIQAVETIRFNPFKGTGEGGNQSFSTSFVSENGDGVVISSLYSRDRVSVFSKPLTKFESNFELTEEEKEVLNGAKKNLKA
jgi:hypothetical protein